MKAIAASTFMLLLTIPRVAFGAPSVKSADVSVVQLRAEHQHNPLGIDVLQPCLGWQLQSPDRGVLQTAYQIQVATRADDLRSENNLVWDSGRVDSDQSAHVVYEGPAPESRRRYYWRVRVWDDDGSASDWSDEAWWETAMLDAAEWQAEWIEPAWEADPSQPQPAPMLRREFEVQGDVQSARLYATAHGVYEMHLNGRRLGDAVLTPGWTSYHNRTQYQTYDVTDLLEEGANTLGAVIGDGWYRGYLGWGGNRNQYGESLALLAQLEVTYGDGRSAVVAATDDEWRAATGPILMSDIYMGETYDARLEKDGWSRSGYDESDWDRVATADHPLEILTAQEAPYVRAIQTLPPVEMLTTPEGDRVVDMGQNMVGWVRLRADGPAGTEITLRHAEVLDSDGNFYTDNLRAATQETTYILKGGGEEVFEPHFTFQGFRYVAVDGYPGDLTLDDLTGVVIHSDMAPTGHFESSHALINQLQHNIVWGQKGNFVDVPTDCPQRDERLGWTGDAQVFAPTAAFNMDVENFFTKWLRDVGADQEADGRIPHVVPDVLDAGGATGWADAGVIVPWVMYRHYGDVRVLEEQYESMKAWIEYMRAHARVDRTEYVWDEGNHFGDWLAYSTDSPAYPGATTNTDLIATAYFAHSTGLVAEAAGLLGEEDDARAYAALRDSVISAFRAEFVTPRGRLSSDTQTAYVLALAFDLLPEDLNEEAARRLAGEVNERGHLTTGFLGTPHLTHVLSENGYLDEAYKLLLRAEYPSWLYPVTMEATTIWERWDGIKPNGTFQDEGMNSFNHYAYGAVGDWLYGVVAGIKPAEPGFRRIHIGPTPGGGLTHVRARLASPHGTIESSWMREGEAFSLDVEIPPNTEAVVRLPHAEAADVTEGGRPLSDREGITRTAQDGEDVVVEVESGRYIFAYQSAALNPADETSDEASESGDEPDDAGDEPGDADGGSEERQGEAAQPFSVETKLAHLIADAEARAVLMEQLPDLMNSFWLSQAMGFPLARASGVIPVDAASDRLNAVDAALQEIAR